MTTRHIIFSESMVLAILAGHKMKTRRAKALDYFYQPENDPDGWSCAKVSDGAAYMVYKQSPQERAEECPYGQPGDRLSGREPWRCTAHPGRYSGSQIADLCLDAGYNVPWAPIQYEADGARRDWKHTGTPPHDGPTRTGRYRHARFMPRWACRLVLEVAGVRLERLQDISEADAQGEGCAPAWLDVDDNETVHSHQQPTFRRGFARLWREISGPSSWDANPWVWVIEFRRLPPGGPR